MSNNLMTIGEIISLIAALTGVIAAIAAWRAAGIAKDAMKRAERVELRGLMRDVTIAAQSVIAESARVDELARSLTQAYDDLFRFAGDAERKKPRVLEVEVYRSQVDPLQLDAIKTMNTKNRLRESSEEQLSELQIKYEGYLIQIKMVKEWLVQQRESVQKEIQPFRDKAIKG